MQQKLLCRLPSSTSKYPGQVTVNVRDTLDNQASSQSQRCYLWMSSEKTESQRTGSRWHVFVANRWWRSQRGIHELTSTARRCQIFNSWGTLLTIDWTVWSRLSFIVRLCYIGFYPNLKLSVTYNPQPQTQLFSLLYLIFTKLLSEICFLLSGMESIVGATIEGSIVRIKMFQVYFLRA